MQTCRDIVTLAMRRLGVVPVDEEITAAEAEIALGALQSYYDGLFHGGALAPCRRVYKVNNYTAQEGDHITVPVSGVTVTIPDSYTANDGEPRAPYELASVTVATGAVETNYVYSLGTWQEASSLELNDEAPLSGRDRAGLAAVLAVEIADIYGAQITPALTRDANNFRRRIIYRDGQSYRESARAGFF